MATAHETILYPHPGFGETEVEILSAERAVGSASLLLNVIEAAYTRQFENPANPHLTPGTVSARYAATPDNLARYSERTAEHYDPGDYGRGSIIAAVHPATPYKGRYFRAFAKATPAQRARATKGKFEGCYLNDVASMVPGVGFGRIAVHAVLTRTDQDPHAPLVLEAFEDSPVNAWYESWGMERTIFVSTFRFGEVDDTKCETLPQVYYKTPSSAGVGDVVRALEAERPYLRHARPAS